MASDPGPSQSPEDIFAEYAVRLDAGETVDFEELCASHPSAASELRALHENWVNLRGILDKLGVSSSPSRKLSVQYGADIDPKVSLEPEGPADSEFASDVINRLSARTGAFGRYRLKGEVAKGGQGAILRVWDNDIRRHLAMKVMLGQGEIGERGDTPPVDSRTLGRFLEEAQVTGQLDHPGIVPVHELGLDSEGRVYFTMKLVRGRDLSEVFDLARDENEGWTRTRALGVLLKVYEAMSYAHANGVIHRDLKPANIMVGRFGEVYVMDWGLARVLGREDEKSVDIKSPNTTTEVHSGRLDMAPDSPLITKDGFIGGTVPYMSPEQAKGLISKMGPPSDVYALGAMLYHLFAGHAPYLEPEIELPWDVILLHVQKAPPAPLLERAPDAPAELVAICEKAMERDVSGRYRDTKELADDLSAFIENRVVSAYETGAMAELRKWVRRNRALAAAALLVFVVSTVSSVVLASKNEELGEANKELESTNESLRDKTAEAESNAREADRQRSGVLGLSAFRRHEGLVARAEKLWPPHPDKLDGLRKWTADAEKLVASLRGGARDYPGHYAMLAELEARALPEGDEMREAARLLLRLGTAGCAPASLAGRLAWRFGDERDEWWHDQLVQLTRTIEGFADKDTGLWGPETSPDHGWGVGRRLAEAEKLEEGFAEGGEYANRWDEAIGAIREHAMYERLEITPQMGLVPIGTDPESGLWEFWHVATGDKPERGENGKLALTEGMGLVLVLIPGGTFWMGAQKDQGPNQDPGADSDESPVHEVTLSPFFLSKYEMTQGQWKRFVGWNRSTYGLDSQWGTALSADGHEASLLHPVESVSWEDCMRELKRMGLSLPKEEQWEYGARAGTDTPWSTGPMKESLQGAANLADEYAKEYGAPSSWVIEEGLNDGSMVHALVGSHAANRFGLHDVHGNVWEWCMDWKVPYSASSQEDPSAPPADAISRLGRGGAFGDTAENARSASRTGVSPRYLSHDFGVRPARAIEP
ncbi:MAG: SUMF1/EgtB/PvdO family nonheme iron enzyme [bacterium]|nr:SUMF1/EgtB/PvdO family nonheme iron enzyme [bacterium]